VRKYNVTFYKIGQAKSLKNCKLGLQNKEKGKKERQGGFDS
jgi:hypothetical protein